MFKHISKSVLFLMASFWLSLSLCSFSVAQDANDNMPGEMRLNFSNSDVRSVSLGNATLADHYRTSAFGINPAILGFSDEGIWINGSISQNRDTNISQSTLTLPKISLGNHYFGTRFTALGESPAGLQSGNMPDFNPTFSVFQANIGYAYRIHDHVSLGLMQYFSYITYDDDDGISYGTDLGVIYSPDGAVSYAATFRGLGQDLVAFQREDQNRLNYTLMRQVLEIGATLRYPEFENYHYFSFSLSNEKRFGETGMWYKAGLEILPVQAIALRVGIMLQSEETVLIPRFGLGLNFAFFRLDYAIAPNEYDNSQFHQLGISVKF